MAFSADQLLEKVNTYLATMPYVREPKGLYAPIEYVLSLGGKRIRPVLMLLSYQLYKENVDDILPQAAGIETYHNYTLLHDDLMDCADMRRNCVLRWRWHINALNCLYDHKKRIVGVCRNTFFNFFLVTE